ncbi:MAG: hypothetical protein IMZ64_05155 [Bacteroidetes bacterium]|nr:hypothetical protein [Bacteroidota bacterium]
MNFYKMDDTRLLNLSTVETIDMDITGDYGNSVIIFETEKEFYHKKFETVEKCKEEFALIQEHLCVLVTIEGK